MNKIIKMPKLYNNQATTKQNIKQLEQTKAIQYILNVSVKTHKQNLLNHNHTIFVSYKNIELNILNIGVILHFAGRCCCSEVVFRRSFTVHEIIIIIIN